MTPTELLSYAVDAFKRMHIDYAVVGSVASSFYGEARLTHDIDVNLKPTDVDRLIEAFPEEDFYLSVEAAFEAIKNRSMFNILHPDSGLKIDIMIPATADSPQLLRRREVRPRGDESTVSFAAPEDVILKKLEYYQEGGSEKHIRDIAGMLRVSGTEIDQKYVADHAERLGLEHVWAEIVARARS